MAAIAAADPLAIGAALAGLKALAQPNDVTPQDARGLLGKALTAVAMENLDAAKAIVTSFGANTLKEVSEDKWPLVAKAIGAAL